MNLPNGQFFQPYHYAAFDEPKPDLDGDNEPARMERLRVKEALMNLGDMLWPQIARIVPKWDLHCHRSREHYASSFHFVPGYVSRIQSMWLHYGKSADQLDCFRTPGTFRRTDPHDDYNAFYKHTRIQVYINDSCVRCWLLLATDKAGYDRPVYRRKLIDPGYYNRLWALIFPLLNKEFFYEIGEDRYELDSTADPITLREFLKKDREGFYTGIVKEYRPEDPRISTASIVSELVSDFELLYPIYDHMAYRHARSVITDLRTGSGPSLSGMFGGTARITTKE
jgi:hypothetical protein